MCTDSTWPLEMVDTDSTISTAKLIDRKGTAASKGLEVFWFHFEKIP